MEQKTKLKQEMNLLGKQRKPFGFLIDFNGTAGELFNPCVQDKIQWSIGENKFKRYNETKTIKWKTFPLPFNIYLNGFNQIMQHIIEGNTYLLNYTCPTRVDTNLTLAEIFEHSSARYKIHLRNEFVCFSPETFIQIENGYISSFPMKGTIDASIKNAQELIIADSKELAEHHTIVDLIRNDIAMVAENVTVEKFRFLQKINTHTHSLWQVSSKITGKLPDNFHERIGDIIFTLLPAGSITGAPKPKTVEIITHTENHRRGYYTGIFGIFDGHNLDSCVLIRFIEKTATGYVYKSGGGITFMSNPENEYHEMLKKVYVPVI